MAADRTHPLWIVYYRRRWEGHRYVEAPTGEEAMRRVRGATRASIVRDKMNLRLFPELFA